MGLVTSGSFVFCRATLALIGAYYTGALRPAKEEDMTVTQTASGQADAFATALAVTINRLRTQSGHPGIACTPELNARWREQIKQSIEEGRDTSVPGRGSVELSFGLDLDHTPALLTEGEDLTLQITWQDGEHWRNDPRWETDPGDRWDVHLALSFAGDRVCSTASNYEFGGTSRPDWLITRLLDRWHTQRMVA